MIRNKRQVSTNEKHSMWWLWVPLGAAGWECPARGALCGGSPAEELGDSPPPEVLQQAPSFPALNKDGTQPQAALESRKGGLQKGSSNPPNVSPPGLMAENYLGESWEVGDAWSVGTQGLQT